MEVVKKVGLGGGFERCGRVGKALDAVVDEGFVILSCLWFLLILVGIVMASPEAFQGYPRRSVGILTRAGIPPDS